MRKIQILTLTFLAVILFNSCGEYQRAIGKGTMEERYKLAVKLYEAKEYSKALRLFEIITPHYRGKPQMERIQFMVAQSNFNTRSYTLSGYYFDRFTKNYPNSSKKKAMLAFQVFINTYPNSSRIDEANKHYKELRFKLEQKQFEIGKTYYKTAVTDFRNYKAAIVTFDNLISEYLGTSLKEDALYYRFKAYHDLVLVSTIRKKEQRIEDAIAAHEKLVRNFPDSKYISETEKMLSNIKNERQKLVKS